MNRRAYWLGVAMVVAAMAGTISTRSYVDAAVLNAYGVRWLPHLLVAQAVATALCALIYDRIAAHTVGRADALMVALAAGGAVLAPVLQARAPWAPFVIATIAVAAATVVGLGLWNSLAASVAGRNARRALPRAGAAVTLGGAIAGLVASVSVRSGAVDLVPIAGGGMFLFAGGFAWAQRKALAAGAPGAVVPPGSSPTMTPRHHRLVRWLLLAAVVEAAVSALVEIGFATALRANYAGPELVAAIAMFYAATNGLLFLLQAAAVPRLLLSKSLPFTLSAHPIGLALLAPLLWLAPGLVTIAVVRTADQILRPATSRTGQEVTLSALPPVPRARWKLLLRGAATAIGAAIATGIWLVSGRTLLDHLPIILAVGGGLLVVWFTTVQAAARDFLGLLSAPLGVGALAHRRAVAVATLDDVRAAVADASAPGRARFGAAQLAQLGHGADEISAFILDEDPAVRAAVYAWVTREPVAAVEPEVVVSVRGETDDEAAALGLCALVALGSGRAREVAQARVVHSKVVGLAVARVARWAVGPVNAAIVAAELEADIALAPGWIVVGLPHRADLRAAVTARWADAPWSVANAQLAIACNSPAAHAWMARVLATAPPDVAAAIDASRGRELMAYAARLDVDSWRDGQGRVLARACVAAPQALPLLWQLAEATQAEVRAAALRVILAHARAGHAVDADRAARAVARELDVVALLLAFDARGAAADLVLAHAAQTRGAVERLMFAVACEAAARGRDPHPVALLAGLLRSAQPAARNRALDVIQEVASARPEVLRLLERWLTNAGTFDAATGTSVVLWHAALEREPAERRTQLARLRQVPWLADVSPEDLEWLRARADLRVLAEGDVLFAHGDDAKAVAVIVDGHVVERLPQAEVEVGPGAALGELAVVGVGRRTATAHARTPATILWLAADDVRTVMAREPSIAPALISLFARWIDDASTAGLARRRDA